MAASAAPLSCSASTFSSNDRHDDGGRHWLYLMEENDDNEDDDNEDEDNDNEEHRENVVWYVKQRP
jgi:hypothetical protein